MAHVLRVYTDGGSRGNPGPAAAGAWLCEVTSEGLDGKSVAALKQYLGETTNNQAEYAAIVLGLTHAKKMGATQIDLVMDSELAVKQLNGEYRVKNPGLRLRFEEVQTLLAGFPRVRIRHVRREKNTQADALVNEALDAALRRG